MQGQHAASEEALQQENIRLAASFQRVAKQLDQLRLKHSLFTAADAQKLEQVRYLLYMACWDQFVEGKSGIKSRLPLQVKALKAGIIWELCNKLQALLDASGGAHASVPGLIRLHHSNLRYECIPGADGAVFGDIANSAGTMVLGTI